MSFEHLDDEPKLVGKPLPPPPPNAVEIYLFLEYVRDLEKGLAFWLLSHGQSKGKNVDLTKGHSAPTLRKVWKWLEMQVGPER